MGEHQNDSALPLVVVQSSCCIGRGEVHAKIEKGKAALNPLGHQPRITCRARVWRQQINGLCHRCASSFSSKGASN